MSTKTGTQLAEKEYYHELTPKQKAIIDAYAEYPESTHTEILEIANEKLEDEDKSITRGYVPVVLDTYEDIAYERKHQIHNGRENGEETTEGDPINGVKEETENVIVMEFTREEVEEIIFTPEVVRERMINIMLDSTFKPRENI